MPKAPTYVLELCIAASGRPAMQTEIFDTEFPAG